MAENIICNHGNIIKYKTRITFQYYWNVNNSVYDSLRFHTGALGMGTVGVVLVLDGSAEVNFQEIKKPPSSLLWEMGSTDVLLFNFALQQKRIVLAEAVKTDRSLQVTTHDECKTGQWSFSTFLHPQPCSLAQPGRQQGHVTRRALV